MPKSQKPKGSKEAKRSNIHRRGLYTRVSPKRVPKRAERIIEDASLDYAYHDELDGPIIKLFRD